ncbi:MAG: peptidylprolyl isomerase [Psychroflexus sp.]
MKTLKLSLIALLGLLIYSCSAKYPDLEDGLYAEFETSEGEFVTELYYKEAPMTVGNFVALTEGNHPLVDEKYEGKKFYDSIIFHRVIEGFMIQGGDPDGTGQGGPGYKFADEFTPKLGHEKGVLSMANAGPNTNGSQFFITLAPTPHLDGKHSVFGKLVVGEKVVDSIGKTQTTPGDKPAEDVVIETINILRKGSEAKDFDAVEAFKEGVKLAEEAEAEAYARREERLNEASKGFDVTESGLRYKIIEENPGGTAPEAGSLVKVHYTGYLLDGTKFDSSLDRDQPIEFPVGTGRVIPGWDEGIMLLKTGEKAELVIPSELAYGARKAGPIPANSILKFEVELLEVEKNN